MTALETTTLIPDSSALNGTNYDSLSSLDTQHSTSESYIPLRLRRSSHPSMKTMSSIIHHPNAINLHHRLDCPYTELRGTSSILNVTWNMLNQIIGTGIFGIPYIYIRGGLLGSMLLMFIFGIIVTYTFNILIVAGKHKRCFNYEVLIEECFGHIGYAACCFCIVLLNFGGMTTFLIIIQDAVQQLLLIFHLEHYTTYAMLVLSFLIIFPPCLYRDLSALEKVSLVKMIAIVTIIIVVFVEFYIYSETEEVHKCEYTLYFGSLQDIPRVVGVIAFTLVCHDSSFLLYQTLDNPTQIRWFQLSAFGTFGAMGFILLLTVPAYLTFGNVIQSNMLNNYSIKDPLIIIMRIVFVITLSLTYPSAFFLVRHIVYSSSQKVYVAYKFAMENEKKLKRVMTKKKLYLMQKKTSFRKQRPVFYVPSNEDVSVQRVTSFEEYEWGIDLDERKERLYIIESEIYTVQTAPIVHHLSTTCLIFATNLACGLTVNNLGLVMGVIGSLSSVNLALVFPCLCYLKTYEWDLVFDKQTKLVRRVTAVMYALPAILVTVLGVWFAIYGVISSLQTSQ
eukprot:68347_1